MVAHRRIYLLFLVGGFAASLFGQTSPDQGREVYELKCGRCHFAYPPKKYSSEAWKTILTSMSPQSGLSREEEGLILDYLQSEAGEGLAEELPTAPVLAGYMYTEFFSGPAMTDTFDIHYLNLTLSGRLHERVSYRAEFEFEHGGGTDDPPFIEWAYIDVRLLRGTGVKIGAIVVPFNRFDDFHAPLENFLISRPQASREIGVSAWKEVGLNFYGSLPLSRSFYFNLDAFVVNGLGAGSRLRDSRQYRDNNDAKSLGFRLSGVLGDRWELGTSYVRGAWDKDSQLVLSQVGFHFRGVVSDFSIHAEYVRAVSENPPPLPAGGMNGYFIQLSYLLWEKFRGAVRFGALDYLDPGNLLGRKPTDYDRRTLALGLNFYPTRAIVFKAEYEFFLEGERNAVASNNVLAFQAAVRF